ncbi:MAG: DUF3783 domain-containing protein [Clostridia bacterium]|nr:DUF3783 domain-containing protein [Clostridia bacterium]
MKPMILVFNIPADKLSKLRFTCMRLGIQVCPVEASDYGQTIGALCGMADRTDAPAPEETFTEDMLVMANFTQQLATRLLAALKQGRLPIRLKAVVTPTNAHWNPVELHKELTAERAAIAQGKEAEHHE